MQDEQPAAKRARTTADDVLLDLPPDPTPLPPLLDLPAELHEAIVLLLSLLPLASVRDVHALACVSHDMSVVVHGAHATLLARPDGGYSDAVKMRYVRRWILRGEDALLKCVCLSEPIAHHENRCMYKHAVRSGHLAAFQWLRANSHPWNGQVSRYVALHAAREGHFHVLRWLIANGIPGDANTTVAVLPADGSHLDVPLWLLEAGSPWRAEACSSFVSHGEWNIVKWMVENRLDHLVPKTFPAVDVREDQRASFAWLQKRGYLLRK